MASFFLGIRQEQASASIALNARAIRKTAGSCIVGNSDLDTLLSQRFN
jgi:hypothetical protein